MLLGKLYTKPLQDHDSGGEIGQFEIDVIVDEKLFLTSGDKPGMVKRQFAAHLASAIHDTKVPIEYWYGMIVSKIASACSLPEFLHFAKAPR